MLSLSLSERSRSDIGKSSSRSLVSLLDIVMERNKSSMDHVVAASSTHAESRPWLPRTLTSYAGPEMHYAA